MDVSDLLAGPNENAISADVSGRVLAMLGGCATEAGTLIGCAAVLTGAMDGVARFISINRMTGDTPEETADLMGDMFSYLLLGRIEDLIEGSA